MIQETAQIVEPTALEATLNNIRTVMDFLQEMALHPVGVSLLSILGYGAARDYKAIGKGAKKLNPLKKK